MTSETAVESMGEVLATNSTDTAFTANEATTTEPTGAGVIDLAAAGYGMPNNLLLVPFGVGNADTTFDMRVTGWAKVATLWVPCVLGQFSCTLGARTGVSGAAVADTDKFVDTITAAAAYSTGAGVSYDLTSPTGDLIAHILLDAKGFGKVEIEFDLTGATSANCLFKKV